MGEYSIDKNRYQGFSSFFSIMLVTEIGNEIVVMCCLGYHGSKQPCLWGLKLAFGPLVISVILC